jgi:hypothetical protein
LWLHLFHLLKHIWRSSKWLHLKATSRLLTFSSLPLNHI